MHVSTTRCRICRGSDVSLEYAELVTWRTRSCARTCVRCVMSNAPDCRSIRHRLGMSRDSGQPAPQTTRRLLPRLRWPGEPSLVERLPRWGLYALRLARATAFALLVPHTLANLGLAHSTDDEMTSVGFDADRVRLIEFALISLAGGVVAGFMLRWRSPVWLGGLLYYVFGYLLPFIGQAQQ